MRQTSSENKLSNINKQIEKLLDQIVEAEGSGAIKAYEKRINKLERERLILQEKRENTVQNRKPFEEMFELRNSQAYSGLHRTSHP